MAVCSFCCRYPARRKGCSPTSALYESSWANPGLSHTFSTWPDPYACDARVSMAVAKPIKILKGGSSASQRYRVIKNSSPISVHSLATYRTQQICALYLFALIWINMVASVPAARASLSPRFPRKITLTIPGPIYNKRCTSVIICLDMNICTTMIAGPT